MAVRVSEADFDLAGEYQHLREKAGNGCGAIVQFVGLVRDFNTLISTDDATQDARKANVITLELEHYAGMTESVIDAICTDAQSRWDIAEPSVIHRVGRLAPGDQIVMVSVASAHRAHAFSACEFIMDQLKTNAPFWKKERHLDANTESTTWLSMKDNDKARARRWDK